jgi:hypothetical protein
MPRYGRTSRGKLSCHVGRKSRLESPAALRQRRITRRLEAATSIPSPMRSQCLNWALGATVFCITAKRPPFGRYGSIATSAGQQPVRQCPLCPESGNRRTFADCTGWASAGDRRIMLSTSLVRSMYPGIVVASVTWRVVLAAIIRPISGFWAARSGERLRASIQAGGVLCAATRCRASSSHR